MNRYSLKFMSEGLSRYHSLKRLKRSGGALVMGPESLRPPKTRDDSGWLNRALRIFHGGIGADWSSVAIFVDNTSNREDNFLRPMLRRASWTRQADLVALPASPSVTVELVDVMTTLPEINRRVRIVQETMRSLPFVPFGLPLDRSGPAIATAIADDPSVITIELWNGEQNVEYTSPVTDEPFCIAANELTAFLWSADAVITEKAGLRVMRGIWMNSAERSGATCLCS